MSSSNKFKNYVAGSFFRINTCRKFLFSFIKNPSKVGAVIPSSNGLSELITDMAELHKKNCVVELGPGTGVFTKKILNKIKPGTCFFCLEQNPAFVKETLKSCPQATVYNSNADNILDYLRLNNKEHCDTVISGIPWTLFNQEEQIRILSLIYDSLEPGGDFLTFMYLSGRCLPGGISFYEILKKKFSKISRSRVVWKNLPPVFVYLCKK